MRNQKLIDELNRTSYFILRNDGLIMRGLLGDYAICSRQTEGDPLAESKRTCEKLNKFSQKIKAGYTYSYILISDYMAANPDFTFK